MNKLVVLFLGLAFLFCGVKNSFADRRAYVWTYEYQTMPKGHSEIEYYITTEVPDTNKSSTNTWKHWLELEYGITDNFDVAMYQMFKQTNKPSGDKSEYDGLKVRGRYKIGKKNQFILDPLLYIEFIRDDDFHKPTVLEGKVILSKDITEALNISYNQILKQELESGGETEHEYALGTGYEFLPTFKFGLESKGNYSKKKYYLGPTASVTFNKFWVAFGALAGLNNKSDDIQTRMIIGIPF